MIRIRELREGDMREAVELRVLCWTEELAGKAENVLNVSEELKIWIDWMNEAKENDDVRLLIGAFEDEKMVGVAFGSFAETYDVGEEGIELNGLWVYPYQRNRGVSLMMLKYMIDFYIEKGMQKIVVYNHRYSPANQFYRKFGAKVLREEYQMENKLLIDIFIMDIILMKENIEKSLKKYL